MKYHYKNGFPKITTEIENFKNFYYAEEYHQQYLLKIQMVIVVLVVVMLVTIIDLDLTDNYYIQFIEVIMKVVSSLKTLKVRDRNCQIVRRRGRLYVINKKNPRFKARQG